MIGRALIVKGKAKDDITNKDDVAMSIARPLNND